MNSLARRTERRQRYFAKLMETRLIGAISPKEHRHVQRLVDGVHIPETHHRLETEKPVTAKRLAKRPLPPTRLVVVHPAEGIAVYNGRKLVAFERRELDYTADEIEAVRTDDYEKEPVC